MQSHVILNVFSRVLVHKGLEKKREKERRKAERERENRSIGPSPQIICPGISNIFVFVVKY